MNKAIFLDRDGVINHDRGYVSSIEDFVFIDGALDACKKLKNLGYMLVVVTNQSGIGRGYYTEADYLRLTRWMQDQFETYGVTLDAVYYCPHYAPKEDPQCACRKPNPGMILEAQAEFNIDVSQSLLVGDKLSDIRAAHRAGVAQALLVRSGQDFFDEDSNEADGVIDSLAALPKWISS